MPSSLTSAGLALSMRHANEVQLSGATKRGMRAFITEVEKDAVGSLSTPSLLAGAGEQFVLGSVLGHWARAIRLVLRSLSDMFRLDDSYMRAVERRLLASDIPGESFTAAKDILREGVDQQLSVEELTQRLLATLGESGVWDSQAGRIARTEATSGFNFWQLTRLHNEGFTKKRWVAHHDGVTRETHMQIDGDVVDLGASFLVGGYGLLVPADPYGPPKETANCRCIVVGA